MHTINAKFKNEICILNYRQIYYTDKKEKEKPRKSRLDLIIIYLFILIKFKGEVAMCHAPGKTPSLENFKSETSSIPSTVLTPKIVLWGCIQESIKTPLKNALKAPCKPPALSGRPFSSDTIFSFSGPEII